MLVDADPRSRWLGLFVSAGDKPVREPNDAAEVLEEASADEADDGDAGDDAAEEPDDALPQAADTNPAH